MTDYPDVVRDPARLAALAETGLSDSPPEEVFDRLTRLAARLLGAPAAFFALADDRRQYFKSSVGLPPPAHVTGEVPLPGSVCEYVVRSGLPLVVGDTAADPLLRDNPSIVRFGIRAYAGYPVATGDGHVLGSFCVADDRPRDWGADELQSLADLAAIAGAEAERRRAEAERARFDRGLSEAEGWYRALVEQSIMAIYCYQDGRFLYVNPKTAELFGRDPEYMLQPGILAEIIHPDDQPRVAENIRRRLAGEILSVRYTLRGVRPDGEIVWLDIHGTRTEVGGRPALIGVGYDITDRVRAERERETAMRARDRFYAMASHELRTPVSTVMLYNDLLMGGMYDALTAPQREAVERAQSSARHLLDLINDLLDLSKLEAGRLDTRREEVEVAELVESVAAELTPLAAEYGSRLDLELRARPAPVIGDGLRIRQILMNLLSNAIKFGQGRPIEVRCGADGGGVAVEVTDHGTGIAPDDLPRIWEDFVQLGNGDGSSPGTGLGLPIARRLAELLGGSIEVTSAPGAGSTFRFCLPSAPTGDE
ncbi:MAG TPA: ATP-binding protein [Longimicrobium sp.]